MIHIVQLTNGQAIYIREEDQQLSIGSCSLTGPAHHICHLNLSGIVSPNHKAIKPIVQSLTQTRTLGEDEIVQKDDNWLEREDQHWRKVPQILVGKPVGTKKIQRRFQLANTN